MTDPTGRPVSTPVPGPNADLEPGGAAAAARPGVDLPRPFTRTTLEAEETEIRDAILRMGSLVAERIVDAIMALETHDPDAALAVIRGDEAINALQREVSSLISRTIATQQPVARDLRFLLTLDHVAYDLERMGDHAGSVAKQARKLASDGTIPETEALSEMGRLVASQVRDVLGAVVEIDEARARAVAKRDDDIDDLYHRIFDETLARMRVDPDNVDPGARILFAAHYLERVGDRVTNIAEDVVFLATGQVEDLNP